MPIRIFSKNGRLNSTRFISLLSLFLLAVSLQLYAAPKKHKKNKGVENTMTVVGFREPAPGEEFMTVMFARSARFYRLPIKSDPKYLKLLKASEHNHTPVLIKRAEEKSDIIIGVSRH